MNTNYIKWHTHEPLEKIASEIHKKYGNSDIDDCWENYLSAMFTLHDKKRSNDPKWKEKVCDRLRHLFYVQKSKNSEYKDTNGYIKFLLKKFNQGDIPYERFEGTKSRIITFYKKRKLWGNNTYLPC